MFAETLLQALALLGTGYGSVTTQSESPEFSPLLAGLFFP